MTLQAVPSTPLIEEWRAISEYEGFYEVSNFGKIKSLSRSVRCSKRSDGAPAFRLLPEAILRPQIHKTNLCLMIRLHSAQKSKWFAVHRLVCDAFNGPPPFPDSKCLHWNDQNQDNRPDNLRWGTVRENIADALRNGVWPVGENHHRSKLTDNRVLEARARHAAGERISSIARSLGVEYAAAARAIHRQTWRHI